MKTDLDIAIQNLTNSVETLHLSAKQVVERLPVSQVTKKHSEEEIKSIYLKITNIAPNGNSHYQGFYLACKHFGIIKE